MSTSTFEDLGVPADLVGLLKRNGHKQPSPIHACLPDAIAGRDVVGCATGSAKTLAFGLPLVLRAKRSKPNRPTALVLTPKKETAAKMQRELHTIAASRSLRITTAFDGVPFDRQRGALRHGVEILIAGPGRLEELLAQRDLRLDDIDIVVIDEADRMVALGLLSAVQRILDKTPAVRQTMVFSSRSGGDVEILIQRYQTKPIRFDPDTGDATAPEEIEPVSLTRELESVSSNVSASHSSPDVDGPVQRSSAGRARRHGGGRRARQS
jgi:superfamily II DNA/RNA helicase